MKAEVIPVAGRHRRRIVLAASVALLGLLAGCGGDDKKASPSDTAPGGGPANLASAKPACDVLSRVDVETAIGAPVADGQAASPLVCRYDLAAGPDQAVVMLLTTDAGNPENFERTKAVSADAQPLPGVAEQAFVTGKQVYLLKGSTIAVIVVNLQRPPAALVDAMAKLGRTVTPKI